MKKGSFFVMLFSAILFCGSIIIFSQNTQAQVIEDDGGGDCKWLRIRCSSKSGGGWFEGCLNNGDGNDCTCGDTTRSCN